MLFILVALQALKRKKRYETQLNQIDGTLTTLEYQREALENANTNTAVLKTMGEAAKAFKSAHLELDIDKVQDLKDEIAEQQELANEISDVISRPIGMDAQIDEDDLLRELEELEQEDLDEKMLEIPSADNLPKVPAGEPADKGNLVALVFNFLINFFLNSFLLLVPAAAARPASSKKAVSAEEAELNELMNWAS